MHKCKTVDCNRQIPDNNIYCSIECCIYDNHPLDDYTTNDHPYSKQIEGLYFSNENK